MDNLILSHILKKSIVPLLIYRKIINREDFSFSVYYAINFILFFIGKKSHIVAGLCRTYRAGIGTGSAFNTFCRVDNIFAVAGFNGVNGAVFCAGAAFNACIGNFVRHKNILL